MRILWHGVVVVFFTGWILLRGASAAPILLAEEMPATSPMHQVQVLQDRDGLITPEEILNPSVQAEFRDLGTRPTSVGLTDHAWWLRLQVENPADQPLTWVLNFPAPLTDTLDFYEQRGDQLLELYRLGDKRPHAARPLPGEGFAVPLTTEAGAVTTLYVRLQNRIGDGLDFYCEILSQEAYLREHEEVWLFFGILLGGGLVLWLYNAFIYLVVRDQIYIWYLLYLTFVLAAFVAISGLGSQYLWSHHGKTSEAAALIFVSMALLLVVQFSRRFLETRKHLPRIDGLLVGLIFYFLLPPILFFSGQGIIAGNLAVGGCVLLSLLPCLSAYLWWRGHQGARIFTIGWGFWFLSIGAVASRGLGWLPTNDFTLRFGWVGILGEAVVFALALADRIRHLQEDKLTAESQARKALARSKDELETLVKERTIELQQLNNEKDKFFSIIAHDLRSPFNGVIGLTKMLQTDVHRMSEREVDDCLHDLNLATSNLHKLLENLLAWARLQRGQITIHTSRTELDVVIEACIAIFSQSARDKEITIKRTGETSLEVEADLQALETVLRNLLSNALKYSERGGTIYIAASARDQVGEVAVRDEGPGMNAEQASRLFDLGEKSSSPGTEGESGTGLGLQLCRELVSLQGGRLTFETELGKGSTFRFTLPLATSSPE